MNEPLVPSSESSPLAYRNAAADPTAVDGTFSDNERAALILCAPAAYCWLYTFVLINNGYGIAFYVSRLFQVIFAIMLFVALVTSFISVIRYIWPGRFKEDSSCITLNLVLNVPTLTIMFFYLTLLIVFEMLSR